MVVSANRRPGAVHHGVLLVSSLCLLKTVVSHRALLTGASCGHDYNSSQNSLLIPDPSLSWAFSHYLDCSSRAVWARWENPEVDSIFYVGVGTPPRPRFGGLRADAVIVGPGLPALSPAELQLLPAEIKADPIWNTNGIGGVLHTSPPNQTTCAHLGTVMKGESTVKNGRCDFYEPYGKTNSWRVLDADNNKLPTKSATYYVAVFLQNHTSGKVGIAVGTWVENFVTPHQIAVPTCNRSMLDWSEKEGDQGSCLPAQACPSSGMPLPNTPCTKASSCAKPCVDKIKDNPMCTFGQQCECATVIAQNPCGTTITGAMGNTVVNDVCAKTCSACGNRRLGGHPPQTPGMKMTCGGSACPAVVSKWEKVNMNMHRGMAIKFSGDVGLDFVRGMIPHHQGAVDMCDLLTKDLECTNAETGDLDGLVHFCNHVRMEQNREISGMYRWLGQRNATASCPMSGMTMSMMGCGDTTSNSSKEFMAANHMMHEAMTVNLSCSHQVDFVRSMIPHHAGAVKMCDILQTSQRGSEPYLHDLCNNITRLQRAEMSWMSQWLASRNHKISASCEACQGGAAHLQPNVPCEDTLSSSSFCHRLGGDLNCKCSATIQQFPCNNGTYIPGFGFLNTSAECRRSCGSCPAEHEPLFHKPCGLHSGHGGSGAHAHNSNMSGKEPGISAALHVSPPPILWATLVSLAIQAGF